MVLIIKNLLIIAFNHEKSVNLNAIDSNGRTSLHIVIEKLCTTTIQSPSTTDHWNFHALCL